MAARKLCTGLHEARYSREGAARGASRRPIVVLWARRATTCCAFTRVTPWGPGDFRRGHWRSSVVDRHPLPSSLRARGETCTRSRPCRPVQSFPRPVAPQRLQHCQCDDSRRFGAQHARAQLHRHIAPTPRRARARRRRGRLRGQSAIRRVTRRWSGPPARRDPVGLSTRRCPSRLDDARKRDNSCGGAASLGP